MELTGEKRKGSTQEIVEEDSHRGTSEDWRDMGASQDDCQELSSQEKPGGAPVLC